MFIFQFAISYTLWKLNHFGISFKFLWFYSFSIPYVSPIDLYWKKLTSSHHPTHTTTHSLQFFNKFLFYFLANSFDSQSNPSYKPWPCVAHVAWMYHCNNWRRVSFYVKSQFYIRKLTCRLRNWLRCNLSVNSAAVIAFGKSCLLANISRTASLSSSSCNWKNTNVSFWLKLCQ